MEKAIFVRNLKDLEALADGYSRIYFGAEFCENLIPTKKETMKAIALAEERGLGFTYVTPYATDGGLKKIRCTIKSLPPGTEAVANDWGVLNMLAGYELTPVAGRALIRYKRDPRIQKVEKKLPEKARDVLHSASTTRKGFRAILSQLGVARVEVDNMPYKMDLGLPKKFRVSVHTPYVYVSTTRQCMTRYLTEGGYGIKACKKPCREYVFTLKNPAFPQPLIQIGNTQFTENQGKPKTAADRIVESKSAI